MTAVGLTKYDFCPTDLSNGQVSSAWVRTGLALALGDTGLWVYNACDENGLQPSMPPEDQELRPTWLDPAP